MSGIQLSEDTAWQRSSYCGSSACVEVAFTGDAVAVRDSKAPERPAMVYSAAEWRDFIAGVRNGEFDLS